MPKDLADKTVDINGKQVGPSSTIKMTVKTAIWIIGTVFSLVMGILTYSYFDLKGKYGDFVNSVDEKVETMQDDVSNIRIGQEGIRGDIKLILYRLDKETANPSNRPVQNPVLPPVIENVVAESDTIN